LEGSYDRHLLRILPTNEDITFDYGGWAPSLASRGLGVTVNESILEQMTLTRQEYVLE
jgi:muconate cycloisomerase